MDISPDQIEHFVEVALQVVGVGSVIAAVTPTPIDNVVFVALKKLINLIGFNFAKAENKEKPGDSATVPKKKKV